MNIVLEADQAEAVELYRERQACGCIVTIRNGQAVTDNRHCTAKQDVAAARRLGLLPPPRHLEPRRKNLFQ